MVKGRKFGITFLIALLIIIFSAESISANRPPHNQYVVKIPSRIRVNEPTPVCIELDNQSTIDSGYKVNVSVDRVEFNDRRPTEFYLYLDRKGANCYRAFKIYRGQENQLLHHTQQIPGDVLNLATFDSDTIGQCSNFMLIEAQNTNTPYYSSLIFNIGGEYR